MTNLTGHGITVALPGTWEGRIGLRQGASPNLPAAGVRPAAIGSSRAGALGETFYPVTHLANFALPADRGDFGSGAVDIMGSAHCLIALVEFGPEAAGTPLFAERRLPMPSSTDFDPNTLQRRIIGQAGYQRFCTLAGRAFCLYIVLGSLRTAGPLSGTVRSVLTGVRIGTS